MTIRGDGWEQYNIWEHSSTVRELYTRRSRDLAEEMTCAAQAAAIVSEISDPGDSLLDVGCGSGYFFHSLRKRGLDVEYWGIDASPVLVSIGQSEMPAFGLPAERLRVLRIEDLRAEVDHVVCMNTLSNLDNYHRPLERLLHAARRSVVLRESLGQGPSYRWVRDDYLDAGVDLRVHVNRYDSAEVLAFVESYGFSARLVVDERTGGAPEDVIGHPHHWTFLVARRLTRS